MLNIANTLFKEAAVHCMAEEFETQSSIHRYHVYQDQWTPVVGEQLLCHAVTIKKSRPCAMQHFNSLLCL